VMRLRGGYNEFPVSWDKCIDGAWRHALDFRYFSSAGRITELFRNILSPFYTASEYLLYYIRAEYCDAQKRKRVLMTRFELKDKKT